MPKAIKETKKLTKTKAVAKKATEAKKPSVKKEAEFSIPVFSLAGVASGQMELPKQLFGQKVNKALLSQAVRVYQTNQKELLASTKTRGEVEGSTAKIFKQKGTGRARHGSIMAPIFVGGGIVFGPKPRKVRLDLPKKMKKAALISALSSKLEEKAIYGVSGLEKATGKTKEISRLINKVLDNKKRSTLIVTGDRNETAFRAVRNIPGVDILSANLLNSYELIKHEVLIMTKDAVEKLSAIKGEAK